MTYYYLPQYKTTSLNVPGGIDDSQTTGIIITDVNNVDITKPGILALTYSVPLDTTKVEFITYTSINGSNELVGVTRGNENFSAKTHNDQAVVSFVISASHINELADGLTAVDTALTSVLTLTGTQTATNKTFTSPIINTPSITSPTFTGTLSGWTAAGETWTYASADDPTYTFTITGDVSTKYYAGMRVWLTQSTGGTKYFIITKVSYSNPTTTITVYGGTDYDLANEAITAPYHSVAKAPAGFPLDPSKWSVVVTDSTLRTQATPANATWYNLGSFTISIPIGVWDVAYDVSLQVNETTITSCQLQSCLSTANNSSSDSNMCTLAHIATNASAGGVQAGRRSIITLTSKTSYYLNTRVNTANIDGIYNLNSEVPARIAAVCAYL